MLYYNHTLNKNPRFWLDDHRGSFNAFCQFVLLSLLINLIVSNSIRIKMADS